MMQLLACKRQKREVSNPQPPRGVGVFCASTNVFRLVELRTSRAEGVCSASTGGMLAFSLPSKIASYCCATRDRIMLYCDPRHSTSVTCWVRHRRSALGLCVPSVRLPKVTVTHKKISHIRHVAPLHLTLCVIKLFSLPEVTVAKYCHSTRHARRTCPPPLPFGAHHQRA